MAGKGSGAALTGADRSLLQTGLGNIPSAFGIGAR